MVFSIQRVCKSSIVIKDRKDEQNKYTTRVLFYNNGRKTLTSTEIKNLQITSTNDILSIRLLEGNQNIKINSNESVINIEIEYLDSSKFFVLEIEHKGHIEVKGRISETGEILQTEPRYWVIVNGLFMIYLLYALFNIMIDLKNTYSTSLINFFLIFGSSITIRFLHSLLFIPDSISGKYLDAKDKFNIEFKNRF